MFTNLNVFRMAHGLATHSGARQAVIAQNMANADTPGYMARDLRPFADLYQPARQQAGLKSTRTRHLFGDMRDQLTAPQAQASQVRLTSNSVSIEEQMLKAVEVERHHGRAIAIYKSSLAILRGALARG